MADGSDEPEIVDSMVALARAGADVVAASRYMRRGRQVGGPRLKGLLSRSAGMTLHAFAGVDTYDPTNNFKLYSRRFLDSVTIESECRLRVRSRAHREGHAPGTPCGGGTYDLAGPHRREEQLQARLVAAALPALVLVGIPRPVDTRRASPALTSSTLTPQATCTSKVVEMEKLGRTRYQKEPVRHDAHR